MQRSRFPTENRKSDACITLCLGSALIASPMAAEESMTLRHGSPAFVDGTPIPKKDTREGKDIGLPSCGPASPTGPRAWSSSLTIQMLSAPRHRIRSGFTGCFTTCPGTTSLAERVKVLPQDGKICLNDSKRATYGGPCPPIGRNCLAGSQVPPESDRHPQAQGLIPRPMPWAPPVTAAAVEVDPVGPAGLRRAEAYSAAVV